MFIIGSKLKSGGFGALSMAPNPYVHLSEADAKKEAERLAALHPEKDFYIFRAVLKTEQIHIRTTRL